MIRALPLCLLVGCGVLHDPAPPADPSTAPRHWDLWAPPGALEAAAREAATYLNAKAGTDDCFTVVPQAWEHITSVPPEGVITYEYDDHAACGGWACAIFRGGHYGARVRIKQWVPRAHLGRTATHEALHPLLQMTETHAPSGVIAYNAESWALSDAHEQTLRVLCGTDDGGGR